MASAPSSFTEELRDSAGEQWERVVGHKFTIELAKGEIDRDGKSMSMQLFTKCKM